MLENRLLMYGRELVAHALLCSLFIYHLMVSNKAVMLGGCWWNGKP